MHVAEPSSDDHDRASMGGRDAVAIALERNKRAAGDGLVEAWARASRLGSQARRGARDLRSVGVHWLCRAIGTDAAHVTL
jgi:hypothetical protein